LLGSCKVRWTMMKLIYIRRTASVEECNEIVESLKAGKKLSVKVHSVAVMPVNPSDTVPDANGDYALLGLWDEIDPLKLQLLYQR
jgi:hypothetical protein